MKKPNSKELTAMVLQGGGALGAYQAGVYEKLAANNYQPDWLAGISIGAINAAIIVSNTPLQYVLENVDHCALTIFSDRPLQRTRPGANQYRRGWATAKGHSVFEPDTVDHGPLSRVGGD